MNRLSFDVTGMPAPQGSKRHVGNGIMVESSKRLPSWRADVAAAAQAAHQGRPPITGSVRLHVNFRFAMPQARPKATRDVGFAPKTTRPDIDKLVRAVCDALTDAGVLASDAVVWHLHATKVEVIGWSGAEIAVSW